MLDTQDKRTVRKDQITHTTHNFSRVVGSPSLSTKTAAKTDASASHTDLRKYKFDDAKLGPVVDAHVMTVAPSSSFIDMKGTPSPQKQKGSKTPLSKKKVAKMLTHSRTNSSESSLGGTSGRPSTDSTWEMVERDLDLKDFAPSAHAHSVAPHSAPASKGIGKKWMGLGGKSDTLTTEKIGTPHLKEDTRRNDRLHHDDTFYPYHPPGPGCHGSGSLNGSTPSLDTQNPSATDSSPATSFMDVSDDGHSSYGHKRSESTDSVAKKWRAKIGSPKREPKVDEFGLNSKDGLHRGGSLHSKSGGKSRPRQLDRNYSPRPSLEHITASTRHGYDIFPCNPFARPPPPNADPEPKLSLEDLAKVDANYASVPEGYEERMITAPRPKGRSDWHDPLGPYNVSEPALVKLPPHIKEQLDREAASAKVKLERDRKDEKEPARLVKEEATETDAKDGAMDTPKVPAGIVHQPPSSDPNKLQKKAHGAEAMPPAPPEAKSVASPKAPKNIPPPLALHHDNFSTSSLGAPDNSVLLKPFPHRPARPLTPEEGIDGAMCLTMDDFELESEVEKPPPLPPKDRGKLSRSNSSSSKSTVNVNAARRNLRRPETLETVASVYSQPSFCEDGDIDLVITPRQQNGRV
ncbi:hypothetical protein FA13DRAFT_977210 [Coprinellus micaceus]|uniref:Uncharacterized protein n=1 Tax=Coprinellus micaceus TaxID=71717 RepID=A0A4Y7SZ23_COPMI|nr:hypothetical protein FA13DRAFT_977210 [Coprinellus micaceus]